MMKRTIAALTLAVMVTGGAAACRSGGHVSGRASALATNTVAVQEKKTGEQILTQAGVPVHGTPEQQVAFLTSLKSSSVRKSYEEKLGIPKTRRPAFYAALLGAAEKGHLSRSAADRKTFYEVTLPALVVKYQ